MSEQKKKIWRIVHREIKDGTTFVTAIQEQDIKKLRIKHIEVRAETGIFISFLDAVGALLTMLARRPSIYRAPGWRLAGVLKVILSKKTYAEVIETHLSDHQIEYAEALEQKQFSKARWITMRCWLRLLQSAMLLLPVSFTRLIVSIWNITAK